MTNWFKDVDFSKVVIKHNWQGEDLGTVSEIRIRHSRFANWWTKKMLKLKQWLEKND